MEKRREKKRRPEQRRKRLCILGVIVLVVLCVGLACLLHKKSDKKADTGNEKTASQDMTSRQSKENADQSKAQKTEKKDTSASEDAEKKSSDDQKASKKDANTTVTPTPTPTEELPESEQVYWSDDWTYASNSKVHQESVTLYHADSSVRKEDGYVVAVNAGHGSKAAQQVQTLCHPDGTAKVTGGSTEAGATTATGANSGTTFLDGSTEASATLSLALILKEKLLAAGYDVLMLRESDDCDLDNIARTVYANNNADCHLALHYDSTESDKGFFYMGVPENDSYRSMEPVASHWSEHEHLGQSLVQGESALGVGIFDDGRLEMDLTQTSYSTVPSVDVEVGDRGSDHSQETQEKIAQGIVDGLDVFFGI